MMIAFYFIGGKRMGPLSRPPAVIGFNFGGNFALFPAATADYFGNKNVGTNYPWVFMAYGVGGVVGPILGGFMGDAKAWMWAFVPAGIACLVVAALAMTLKREAEPARVGTANGSLRAARGTNSVAAAHNVSGVHDFT